MMRRVAGCMTGTSIDAVDAALLEISGAGLAMSSRFMRGVSRPLGALAQPLRRLAQQEPMRAAEIAGLAREFALLHAEVVSELAAGQPLDLICVHGQTVYHAPPVGWQLFNPAPLVQALRAPLVFDLRSADIAAGGQGAPITPLADWVLFRDAGGRSSAGGIAIVNLGGFVNMTFLPGAEMAVVADSSPDLQRLIEGIGGGDVCACNQLLDAIARTFFNAPFDEHGRHAAAGQAQDEALNDLVGNLSAQAGAHRSLGTGDEALAWIDRWRSTLSPNDLAATACQGIAQAVGGRTRGHAAVLAGGGMRNRALRAALDSACAGGIITTDDFGIPSEFREAACFAVLGALCQDRVPITLPRITGVPEPAPLAGCWMYP
jgi:anhydro-N-acetylmuramic acid kinase